MDARADQRPPKTGLNKHGTTGTLGQMKQHNLGYTHFFGNMLNLPDIDRSYLQKPLLINTSSQKGWLENQDHC